MAGSRRARPAAGGGHRVQVDPERLERWVEGFRERHGDIAVDPTGAGLMIGAFDGTVAVLHPPPGATGGVDLAGFVVDSCAPRRVGLLLARSGAAAVGVAVGEELERSKVDSWYVQGRTAAGGRSQRRFANRRANQATAAAGKAADIAARVLVPAVRGLSAVVTGGDRRTVDTILADPRLAPLRTLRSERHLEVGTPNLAALRAAVRDARTVTIDLPQPADSRE